MITTEREYTVKDLRSDVKPIWCPGCGDYGVLNAIMRTIINLKLDPNHVAIASGIGCSGRLPAFVQTYGFHGAHGRALPLGTGIKLANQDLTVFVVGGDGDAFSIGAGHLPHAARRNVDLTYIVMDNMIYGLTKGQPSATSPPDVSYDSTKVHRGRRKGMLGLMTLAETSQPLNPIAMALSYQASFVARGFSGKPKELLEIMQQAVLHRGFSFIQVLSPCTTFYDTFSWLRDRVEPLPENHDRGDLAAAFKLALEVEQAYTGIFYKDERATMEELLDEPLTSSPQPKDIAYILERFRK